MLTLIQYAPAFGTRSASPFCTKVEGLLRMSGLEFKTEVWADPRKAPKGKLPVLRDAGEMIADSAFIRKHLEDKYDIDFDSGLDPGERAVADAFTKLFEEHFYWVIVHSRWWEDDNWQELSKAYFASIPALLRPLALPIIRNQAKAQIKGHGMGLHSAEEIYEMGRHDVRSIANFLGDKAYFMGDEPSAIDATAYAFLASLIDCDLPCEIDDALAQYPQLNAYCKRFSRRYFGANEH